jgi:hypothetical protein
LASLFVVVTGPRPTRAPPAAAPGETITKTVRATPGVAAVGPLPRRRLAPPPVTVLGIAAAGGVDGSIDVASKLLRWVEGSWRPSAASSAW